MGVISKFIEREFVLVAFLILFVFLAIFIPQKIQNYPGYVDWKTIVTLSGLLIITTGLKESGYLHYFAQRRLLKVKNERQLALLLVFLSAFLSAFFTNDITLFIVIPLTMAFQDRIENDISKMVIFEIFAVNIGSMLTPIGNPQNIYIWHHWDVPFFTFIYKMLPVTLLSFSLIVILTLRCFGKKDIRIKDAIGIEKEKRPGLFNFSVGSMIALIIGIELNRVFTFFCIIFVLYMIFQRHMIFRSDWLLILLFIVIFIDFRIISTLSGISDLMNSLNLGLSRNLFLASAIVSQIFSNVPAAIFISGFGNDWIAISYGVNIGGNGIVWSSLANIIGLRMMKDRRLWASFHKYSLPFLLFSGSLAFLIFFAV